MTITEVTENSLWQDPASTIEGNHVSCPMNMEEKAHHIALHLFHMTASNGIFLTRQNIILKLFTTVHMDKAALLESVIDHVKDLKRKAMDVSRAFTVPTEIDEVSIDSEQK